MKAIMIVTLAAASPALASNPTPEQLAVSRGALFTGVEAVRPSEESGDARLTQADCPTLFGCLAGRPLRSRPRRERRDPATAERTAAPVPAEQSPEAAPAPSYSYDGYDSWGESEGSSSSRIPQTTGRYIPEGEDGTHVLGSDGHRHGMVNGTPYRDGEAATRHDDGSYSYSDGTRCTRSNSYESCSR